MQFGPYRVFFFSEEIFISTNKKREILVSLKRILLVKWK